MMKGICVFMTSSGMKKRVLIFLTFLFQFFILFFMKIVEYALYVFADQSQLNTMHNFINQTCLLHHL